MSIDQHRATARVLDILEHLAGSEEDGCTLTELSSALHAPKSSLFPILHTLADRNYIRLNEKSGRYSIGIASYVLSASFTEGQGALKVILEVMEQIVTVCGETCQLAVLDRSDALYLGKIDSSQTVRLVSHVGSRIPANCTAIGKALLSGLTDTEVAVLYSEGLPQMTKHSITELSTLLKQLSDVREKGFSFEIEESSDYLRCLAVPLKRQGHVFAAISVSVPLFRYTAEAEALIIKSLYHARDEIERIAADPSFTLGYSNGMQSLS